MDRYIRALERTGLDRYDIATRIFEEAGTPGERKLLGAWVLFLVKRHENCGNSHGGRSYAEFKDEDIKQRIRNVLQGDVSTHNSTLFNEGVFRGIKVYASVECCKDTDCEICKGAGVIYTKKVLFPTNRVYH